LRPRDVRVERQLDLRDSLTVPDNTSGRYMPEYREHLARTNVQREEAVVALKELDNDEPAAANGRAQFEPSRERTGASSTSI
jgi:hypothetical protein